MAITNTAAKAKADYLWVLTEGRDVERTEAQGQAEVVASAVLPAEVDAHENRAAYEALGVSFGEPVEGDPLFVHAVLPQGWTRARSDHPMWSHVLDERGRRRIEVFYKAAHYDRRARMRLVPRVVLVSSGQRGWAVRDNAEGVSLAEFSDPEGTPYAEGTAYGRASRWMEEHGTAQWVWT